MAVEVFRKHSRATFKSKSSECNVQCLCTFVCTSDEKAEEEMCQNALYKFCPVNDVVLCKGTTTWSQTVEDALVEFSNFACMPSNNLSLFQQFNPTFASLFYFCYCGKLCFNVLFCRWAPQVLYSGLVRCFISSMHKCSSWKAAEKCALGKHGRKIGYSFEWSKPDTSFVTQNLPHLFAIP